MKIKYFCFITAILVLISSCGTDDIPPQLSQEETINVEDGLSVNEAKGIASFILMGNSRGETNVEFKITPILKKQCSRVSENTSDTLAYILNTESNGWAIIANNKHINPVLAYNYDGIFDLDAVENQPVQSMFLDLLDDYISTYSLDSLIVFPPTHPRTTYVEPQIDFSWDQTSPYDTYVVNAHGNVYVGCNPVATGMIMTYCRDTLTYHDELFNFKEMRYTFKGNNYIFHRPLYTMDEAIDRAAKLLYYIGPDVNITYQLRPAGSGAASINSLNLLKDLGYNVPQNYLYQYNDSTITSLIVQKYLIYIQGSSSTTNQAHAWVIDGVRAEHAPSSTTDNPIYSSIYVHCRWGWGGSSDGYYTGNIFTTTGYTFDNSFYYFAVKQEITNYTAPIRP